MNLSFTIISILADGQFHSGSELGQLTGRTRSAVWKTINVLRSSGIEIYSVHGKGYRLSNQIELLNSEKIRSCLDSVTSDNLHKIEVLFEVDSTNSHLLEKTTDNNVNGAVCLAEQQLSGRGRRGRVWTSPFGGNIYLSLLWQFRNGVAQLGGLSLAMAIAITRVLRSYGLNDVDVKWPNDILISNQKLAGILLEVKGETAGPCTVVVGLGLNLSASSSSMAAIDQPWTDLESALGRSIGRNELAGKIINHLVDAIKEFEKSGLAPFLKEWQDHDSYLGKEVVLQLPDEEIHGVVRGVDNTGALLLARAGELRRFHSGEVSMRPSDNQQYSSNDPLS